MSLLAIDMGSSACKAVAFTATGEILGKHACAYTPEHPQPGFAEMDPDKFWNALCACCRAVTKQLNQPVKAICLSSHGETFVPVDSHGEARSAAILNQDSRAMRESESCSKEIGRKRLFEITGLVAHPMYPIPKILWLRKHQPEIFASTACFVTLIGYLLQKLGLPAYVDYSLASRFLAFDIHNRCWSDEILSSVGLQADRLPSPVPAGTVAGELKAEAANNLGLPVGTMVVLGGHDQPCGALGMGVVGPGRVSDSMGTYECLVACSDQPCLSDIALSASLNSYCHVVPEKFVTLAYFPSGIMVKWFHDLLYANRSVGVADDITSLDSEAQHYDYLEAQSDGNPTGLCVTPHLIGTCNPDFNPHVRAAIAGLGPQSGPAQIYKGILEGLACELSLVSEVLEKAVGGFHDLYVTGGGTRSAMGLQLRAALTRRTLHVMAEQEAVCLGTAILASVAAGEYRSIAEAVEEAVHETGIVEPEPTVLASYEDQLARYSALRSAMTAQAYA
jgi:xylulokinase